MIVFVVNEIEGGKILKGFTSEIDATCWLNWEEATGNVRRGDFKVSSVKIEDWK